MFFRRFFLYRTLMFWLKCWSVGCVIRVHFGGKNRTRMLRSVLIYFLRWRVTQYQSVFWVVSIDQKFHHDFASSNQFLKPFLVDLYTRGSSMFLKALGFAEAFYEALATLITLQITFLLTHIFYCLCWCY